MKIIVALVLCLLLVSLILASLFALLLGESQSAGGGMGAEARAVVALAQEMAAHLHCRLDTPLDCNDPTGPHADVWYDAGFPQQVLAWAQTHCPGCSSWSNGSLQCVPFVIAAYAFVDPLPVTTQNADQYWEHFAHQPAWLRIPAGALPLPGDMMVWSGGAHGHVSIVLAVTAQSITFAQANGQAPIQTLPLRGDGTVNTHNGYWDAFTVQGYLRPKRADAPSAGTLARLPASAYVTLAWQAARAAGLSSEEATLFLWQINQESGYRPEARSSSGALGIAQMLPATAQALGVDPWNPEQALTGAARLMARFLSTYQGDRAKALAAYNAGSGTVEQAVLAHGTHWLAFLPQETQAYVTAILSASASQEREEASQ